MLTIKPSTKDDVRVADALGELSYILSYPDGSTLQTVHNWRNRYSGRFPKAGSYVADFEKFACGNTTQRLEEIYTRTFDMAPLCNPYISAHLYGDESFDRGTLMSKLDERYRQDNFKTDGELPDHLRIMLRFAPKFSQEELSELNQYCLSGPVKAMCESIKEQDNPYWFLLQATLLLLQAI